MAEAETDWDRATQAGTFTIRVAVERRELAALRTVPDQVVWGESGNSAYVERQKAPPGERGYIKFDDDQAVSFFRRLMRQGKAA